MAIVTVDPQKSLDDINKLVAQSEMGLNGPLKAIGNKDGKTIIEIDGADPAGKPAKAAVITTGDLPAGAKKIGDGKVYIENKLTQATAYRPA